MGGAREPPSPNKAYLSLIWDALANQARLDALDRAEVASAGLAVLDLTTDKEGELIEIAAETMARLPASALHLLGLQGLRPHHLA